MDKLVKSTGRGPGRLTAEETAKLETRLLEAAETVFVEMGYARATMEEIARHAGAGRKTLYARYANKAELLSAVVERLLDSAIGSDQAAVRAQPRGDTRSQLLKIGKQLASLSEAPHVAGINRLIFAEAAQAPDLAGLFLHLHARASDDVKAVLDRLQEQGALPRLADSRMAAAIFIEMTASLPRLRALLGKPLSKRETTQLIDTAVDIFLHGCASDKPSRQE